MAIAKPIADAIKAVENPTDERPAWLQALNDADLVSNEQAAEDYLANEERKYLEKTAQYRKDRDLMRAEIVSRIRANGLAATQLAHDDYVVELKVTTKIDHRIDVLRTLEAHVPKTEFDSAVCLVQAPPEWKANAVKIKALAKRYGGVVAEIAEKGLPKVVVGAPKLVISQREELKRAA